MVTLAGCSSSSNCMALRTCVCSAKFVLPKSSIAQAIRLPSACIGGDRRTGEFLGLDAAPLEHGGQQFAVRQRPWARSFPWATAPAGVLRSGLWVQQMIAVSCASITSSKSHFNAAIIRAFNIRNYARLSRSDAARARSRHEKIRPHRHRHDQRVRLPDALRSAGGLPAGHHQEVPHEIHRPRTAVVPAGQHQHQIPQGQRRQHLGRVGGRERQPRPGVRQAVALVGDRGRPRGGPDFTKSSRRSRRIRIRAA